MFHSPDIISSGHKMPEYPCWWHSRPQQLGKFKVILLISMVFCLQVTGLATAATSLAARVITARTTTTANAAGDYSAVMDYTLSSGTWCGPQTLTGQWSQYIVSFL